jgi:cystathionine beta-lyase
MPSFSFKNLDRSGTDSIKWELGRRIYGSSDVLPMWIADGDTPCAPEIAQAIRERSQHEIFGYTQDPATLFPALQRWFQDRFSWDVEPDWHIHSPGVVSALHVTLMAFCQPGDRVLLQPPVYHKFLEAVHIGGYQPVFNPLKLTTRGYEIDFEGLEREFAAGVKVFLLCSPHNPVGRVWTKGELDRLLFLAKAYDVLVFSDEIFSDVVLPGHVHTPLLKLGETSTRVIVCNAPTKTFNIAGLQMANVWIADPEVRAAFLATRSRCGIPHPNLFGLIASVAAYEQGSEWLAGFLQLLRENATILKATLAGRVDIAELQGTYLGWLDFRKLGLNQNELSRLLVEDAKVGLSSGSDFGIGGDGFMRMNLSCDHATVTEAAHRILRVT